MYIAVLWHGHYGVDYALLVEFTANVVLRTTQWIFGEEKIMCFSF